MEAPWGWQMDGHHLNLNDFFLKDHVVMTPAFWGVEPAIADRGPYAGLRGRALWALLNTFGESVVTPSAVGGRCTF
jgi:hypothetical protein